MFVYESGNSLNLTFKGSIPVENPEVVIKGYENGASLTVNGTEVVSVADAKEFTGKAKTLVFQKDNKLWITFKGLQGITSPEVSLDEIADRTVEAVVNGTKVVLKYTDDSVTVDGDEASVEEPDNTDEEETPEVVTDEEPVDEVPDSSEEDVVEE